MDEAFYKQVAQMRRMQNRYYKLKDPLSLMAAKQAEKNVDAALISKGYRTKEEKDSQQNLF